MKKISILILVFIMLIISISCSDKSDEADYTNQPPSELPKISAVFAGELKDNGLCDSAKEGINKLSSDFGIEISETECKNDKSTYQDKLLNAAKTSDIVIAIGNELTDAITNIATDMQSTKFIVIDTKAAIQSENVLCITYAINEGSFLAGYLAANLSNTKIIGIACTENTDDDYTNGYTQGAKYVDANIEIYNELVDDISSFESGADCANKLCEAGCDIVYSVAGDADNSIFETLTANSCFAIGSDFDKCYINPEVIIGSMIKDVGESIYGAVANYINAGLFEGGTLDIADINDGMILMGYSESDHVNAEVKTDIENVAMQIASGEILVDSTRPQ